jgi:hypothetical protein
LPLHDKVTSLLEECLCAIRHRTSQVSQPFESRGWAAQYLLTEAREYVDAAFILLEAGKAGASLAVSRWVLEAALNLLWATAEDTEVDKRLQWLLAEAHRQQKLRFEGLATLYPRDAQCLLAQADYHEKERVSLVGKEEPPLSSFGRRLQLAIRPDQAVSHQQLYALYRVCCAAAHPTLEVWRRFRLDLDVADVASPPPDRTQIALFMIAASGFQLVAGVYCLTNLGDADSLKAWWEKDVAPLLARH